MFNIEDIKITPEMLSIIAEIDEFKGSWRVLGKVAPERLQSLKKVATIESIGSSNRIEGNKLNDKQVEELLSRIDRKSFASRDEEEVAGYADLMDTIFDNWELIPLTENYIKQFHKTLLKYSVKDETHRGEYKKLENKVVAYDPEGTEIGVVFETASPFETPQKMIKLVDKANELLQDKFLHPLITVGVFIVHFLAVHPFQDGNGRLSRALTTLLLLKTGYSYVPYSSMEAIIEDNKEGYYRALRQTQMTLTTSNDYEPWLMFFLRTMQKQKVRLENKVDTNITEMTYLPELSAKIMNFAQGQERITISEVIEKTGANPNTIKKHLAELVTGGYLVKHGKTRGAWYTRA